MCLCETVSPTPGIAARQIWANRHLTADCVSSLGMLEPVRSHVRRIARPRAPRDRPVTRRSDW
jgi:hypothetical protein